MAIAASLAISAVSHAYLYSHGYREIPTIGTGFLLHASISLAVAALLAVGGPDWLVWAAGVVAAGALGAFVVSRTVGIGGFVEYGWEPAPHALISVMAEAVTVVACGAWWLLRRATS